MVAPVVIIFTKHDLLVLSRSLKEEWEEDDVDEETPHARSTADARDRKSVV